MGGEGCGGEERGGGRGGGGGGGSWYCIGRFRLVLHFSKNIFKFSKSNQMQKNSEV